MDSFLAVAEELKIKGLTQSSNSTQPESKKSKGNLQEISNTRKRSGLVSQPRAEEDQAEIEEIPTIKTEPGGQSLAQYQEEELVEDYDYEDQEVQYDNTLTSSNLEYEQGKVSGGSLSLTFLSSFLVLKHKIMDWLGVWDGYWRK